MVKTEYLEKAQVLIEALISSVSIARSLLSNTVAVPWWMSS